MATSSVRQILAVKLGHIGDVLLMTPALEVLHRAFPDAEICAMVRRGTEEMLLRHPLVKQIITGADIGPKKLSLARLGRELSLARDLRKGRFDLAVIFSSGDRGAICGVISGAKHRVGYAVKRRKFWSKDRLFTHVCHRPRKRLHAVLKDVQLVCDYAAASGRPGFDPPHKVAGPLVLNPSLEALAWARALWRNIHTSKGPRVLIHPTSRWLFKCWDDAKVAALQDRLHAEFGATTLLTTGPERKEVVKGKQIIALCKHPPHAHCGDVSLGQLAALIKEADLFVGVDTAPLHMAAAVGTPAVAIFGPSFPEEWSPWGDQHRVVVHPCPCKAAGKILCDKKFVVRCLAELGVDEVFEAARQILNARGKPV